MRHRYMSLPDTGPEQDLAIAGVLATYHEMIAAEQANRTARPVGGRHLTQDPAERDALLRAVGPETGRLVNVLARSLDAPVIVELGTSYGYSGIWLAEAARATGGRLMTMELHDYKSAFAAEMSQKAGLRGYVDFQVGDAVQLIEALPAGVDFVLMDLWKDLYVPCLYAILSKLRPGAILVADNVGPGQEATRAYVDAVRAMPGMASIPVPVGQGLEISRVLAS